MNGPDLTGAGGRDKVRDLLTLIIDPSSQFNEPFAPIEFSSTSLVPRV